MSGATVSAAGGSGAPPRPCAAKAAGIAQIAAASVSALHLMNKPPDGDCGSVMQRCWIGQPASAGALQDFGLAALTEMLIVLRNFTGVPFNVAGWYFQPLAAFSSEMSYRGVTDVFMTADSTSPRSEERRV